MIDKKRIEAAVREIILALGDDPNREGLIDTPLRAASMYEEMFDGMNYSNDDIAIMLDKTFEEYPVGDSSIVVVKDIEIFSFCEHHLALMYDMKVSIAYKPNGKVIGLSKLARICDLVSKRLQLQERIGEDILYIVKKITNSQDILVRIEGKHSCMSARGIKKNSLTVTKTKIGNIEESELNWKH